MKYITPVKLHSNLGVIVTNKFGRVHESLRDWYMKNFGRDTHYAIDFILSGKSYQSYGSELLSIFDGTVSVAIQNDPFGPNGNAVRVISDDGKWQMGHYHCSKIKVKLGDKVKVGQTVGLMGNTGKCSPAPTVKLPFDGTHDHFTIYERVDGAWIPRDPLLYIDLGNFKTGKDTSENEDVYPLEWSIKKLTKQVDLLVKQFQLYVKRKTLWSR